MHEQGESYCVKKVKFTAILEIAHQNIVIRTAQKVNNRMNVHREQIQAQTIKYTKTNLWSYLLNLWNKTVENINVNGTENSACFLETQITDNYPECNRQQALFTTYGQREGNYDWLMYVDYE